MRFKKFTQNDCHFAKAINETVCLFPYGYASISVSGGRPSSIPNSLRSQIGHFVGLGAELSFSPMSPGEKSKKKEDIIEPEEIRDGTDL